MDPGGQRAAVLATLTAAMGVPLSAAEWALRDLPPGAPPTVPDALDALKRAGVPLRCPWRELISDDARTAGRRYYHNPASNETSWDKPEAYLWQERAFEAEAHSLSLSSAERLSAAVSVLRRADLVGGFAADPFSAPAAGGGGGPGGGGPGAGAAAAAATPFARARATLTKLFSNVLAAPREPKFRSLKRANPALRSAVLDLPGGEELLIAAGFRPAEAPEGAAAPAPAPAAAAAAGDAGQPLLLLPAAAPLGPLRFALARLGDGDGEGEAPSAFSTASAGGGPAGGGANSGRRDPDRWQAGCKRCGACGRLINDGAERLWTGAFDAPRGEFRYHCAACADFDLCEGCNDRRAAALAAAAGAGGAPLRLLHPADHPLEPVAPVTTRHNTAAQGDGAWGAFVGGPSARSRDRLRERTGL